MTMGLPGEPQAPSPPPERGRSAGEARRVGVKSRFNRTAFKTASARRLRRDSTRVEMRLWQNVGRNKRREAKRTAPGGAAQCASLTAPYDFLMSAQLTPTRRWRHSRCFASAFLVQSTAAEGRLCLPHASSPSPERGGSDRRRRSGEGSS